MQPSSNSQRRTRRTPSIVTVCQPESSQREQDIGEVVIVRARGDQFK